MLGGKQMRENEKRLGILFILGASFGFALMSLMVRLSGDLPIFEKAFFRNLITTIFSMVILLKNKEKKAALRKLNKKAIFLLTFRSMAGTAGIIFNFYAIDHMNIADANMLIKLSPFFALFFSYLFLREKATSIDMVATFIAFIGALFVVKPGFNSDIGVALIAVLGALTSGLAYSIVRILTKRKVESVIIVLYFSLFSTLVTLPLMLLSFKPISFYQFLALIGAGLSAMMGQVCLTQAYKYAPAKEIGVFEYTQIIHSALLGFIFLSQIPDIFSVIGYFIITGMGILKWRYNLKHTEN